MTTYLVSDWISDFLAYMQVRDIFYVSGGGAMFLIDSFGRHPRLRLISNHHEQASAMCAEAYYRVQRRPGVCLATTGPAATNIITGVVCSWMDSIPTFFITGQAKSSSLIGDSQVRQRGVHEANICSMLQKSTKSSRLILSKETIIPDFVTSWATMLCDRPGPVHLDIPLDIQSSPFELFNPSQISPLIQAGNQSSQSFNQITSSYENICNLVFDALRSSSLPSVLAGYGVFLSNTIDVLDSFCHDKSIPLLSTKNLYGHLASVSSFHPGHVGTYGNRMANLVLQSSDLLLVLGSRLAAPVTGYDLHLFAPYAKVIIVDIDPLELHNVGLPAKKICAPLAEILPLIADKTKSSFDFSSEWNKRILSIASVVKDVDSSIHAVDSKYINPYWFTKVLVDKAPDNAIIAYDQGAAYYCSTLSNNLKRGQLMFSNGGFTPMGYGLPAAIGAWYAADGCRPVICIHGDGGLQMNVQELQTIKHNKIPIKLFVYSNEGYLSIKNTQDAYFSGRYFGSDPTSGLSCPSFAAVADAYGIDSYSIQDSSHLLSVMTDILSSNEPVLVELMCDPHQVIGPRVSSRVNPDGSMSSCSLADMTPSIDSNLLATLFP
jgi:acetolactate synthase-1/2/3 large subunit